MYLMSRIILSIVGTTKCEETYQIKNPYQTEKWSTIL